MYIYGFSMKSYKIYRIIFEFLNFTLDFFKLFLITVYHYNYSSN